MANRTKLFLKNGIIIFLFQILNYFSDFLNRTALIYTVSMDYIGVRGLCSNILTLLSLSDLGMGVVIIYSMYKPLADHDNEKILALLGFYKKAYYIISGVIATLGIILTPFFPYLIKDCPDIKYIHLIFLLSLANSVLSYQFIFKASVVDADQKMYIRTTWRSTINMLCNACQILCLFLTHNIILYLMIQIVFTITGNILLTKRVEKEYPFIKTKKYPSLTKEESTALKKNAFAMFNHRLGGIVLLSTDNLIISRFVGITAVAINYNYSTITGMIDSLMSKIFSVLSTSIGNLNATSSKDNVYKVFKILHFSSFWFYSFSTSCLLLLLNPFIELLWGKEYLFSMPIVTIICINFYVKGIRSVPLAFRDSLGIFWYDRYKAIITAAANLVISLIAIQYFSVFGVFLGTFISEVGIDLWVEPYILFKYGLKRSWNEFWKENAIYFFVSFMATSVTYFVGSLYHGSLLSQCLYRMGLCIIIPNFIILLIFHRKSEFKQLLSTLVK